MSADSFQRQASFPMNQPSRPRTGLSFNQILSSPEWLSQANAINPAPQTPLRWHNDLKDMFHKNQAVIYALNIRTFGAEDRNGDGRISPRLMENGTFLSAAKHLDQLVALGINTIHVLPINPIGKQKRLGAGGSLYAPSDYTQLNPEFDTPNNNLDVLQEARIFVNECHKRGIHVMVDVPSCASIDLAKSRPDLILKDHNGKPLTPTNWIDIVMFKSDKALQDYYEGFFDLMANKVGVDGFRVDVARARPLAFWQHFIGKYPNKAWLAESYCQEDQSPLKNLPRDIPEDLLRVGFDSFYGQFHIFHSMGNAKEYMDYLLSNRAMFQRASKNGGNDKSAIGSFLHHDDVSLMEHGGVPMCLLVSGLMTTQPWTNPYMLDGFTTGYTHDFDIFNFVPQHKGYHPEIGLFLKHMLAKRQEYGPVLTQGAFIPIPVKNVGPNNQIIAFARQAAGKTLLIVANKDINARQTGTLQIPGLNPTQPMKNLVPSYGRPSDFKPGFGQLSVDLGPGRFHMFEINTPNLAQQLPAY
jgi:glycosidase